jgi:hypothetical protein
VRASTCIKPLASSASRGPLGFSSCSGNWEI